MGLGLKGERVAKTPMRLLPPSLGGRTVGDHLRSEFSENFHKSQRWVKSSKPLIAVGSRYCGSKTILPLKFFTIPLCLGIPNFSGKSVRITATISKGLLYLIIFCFFLCNFSYNLTLIFVRIVILQKIVPLLLGNVFTFVIRNLIHIK